MEIVTEKYDVAICGAGPAGSTCALALEGAGLKIVLIDKSSFPRDKVCGDVLATYVPKVLNSIHPKYNEEFKKFTKKTSVRKLKFIAPNNKSVSIGIKNVEGYCSARVDFDFFLFELASKVENLTVRNNTTIKNAVLKNDYVQLTTGSSLVIEAKMVIGCDGAQSIINKKLTTTKVDHKHYAGAVRAYYKNVSGLIPETIEFHYNENIFPGYLWIFPMSDNKCNVGLGMVSKFIAEKKVNLNQVLKDALNSPSLKDRFSNAEMLGKIEGFGLPLGSRKVTVSGERFILCGDAASLVEPAFGEGIGQAIVSGRYAGWHAKKCFENNDFSASFMKGYDKVLYDKLWGVHYRHYLFQRLITWKPQLLNVISGVLRTFQKIKKTT